MPRGQATAISKSVLRGRATAHGRWWGKCLVMFAAQFAKPTKSEKTAPKCLCRVVGIRPYSPCVCKKFFVKQKVNTAKGLPGMHSHKTKQGMVSHRR